MSPWDAFLQWLTGSWTDSGTQSLRDAIQILSATPWPDLTVDWFKSLWNSIFGLSMIVALLAIVIHSSIFMFRAREGYSLVGSLAIFGRTLLSGLFGLLGIYAVILLSGVAVQFLIAAGNIGTSGYNWLDPFNLSSNSTMVNIWNKLGLAWIGMTSGQLLSIQANITNGAIYVFALYSLLTAALGQSKVMQWLRSLLHAALWTSVVGRVFQIGWLVLMSIIIHYSVAVDTVNTSQVLFATLIAAVIPIIIFFGLTARAVRVEGKLDVRRNMREDANQRAKGATQAEIIENRVQKVSGLKTVAIGAATAGAMIGTEKLIAKAIGPIIAKLSGIVHPAAPIVISGITMAAGTATRSIQRKISTTSDRIGSRGR